MPRRRQTDDPKHKPSDPVTTMMAMLLPLHSAVSFDWLADAAATAAERTLNAPYAFLYFEESDGKLARRIPVSDIRRRSQQRAFEAFGEPLRTQIDPSQAPAIAEALDGNGPVTASARELLRGLVEPAVAEAGQKTLGVDGLSFVPIDSAGERLGALLLMSVGEPNPDHVRMLGQHVACAAVNLRQAQAAREDTSFGDVVRTVFDARKTESELQRELGRADRYKRPISVCVIEATNLRLLRQRFGAFLTERLYDRLGERLAQHSREIDVIGQYKQSGYTMILSEAASEGAQTAARRMMALAKEATLDSADRVDGLELHLAAGWATYPADGRTTEALFAAADRRMYDPKTQVA